MPLSGLGITKEVVGIHVLLTHSPFGGGILRRLFPRVLFGPNLAGGFRVPTREVGGGICCKFRRVIPRRASIAPVIVGIALSSSSGVWNRCAGSFSRSFSRRTMSQLRSI